jgi:hypothetical protein
LSASLNLIACFCYDFIRPISQHLSNVRHRVHPKLEQNCLRDMSFDLGVHAWMHGDVLWNVTYFPLDATMNKERTKLQREKMCHATQVSGVCCKTCCILIGTNANILLLYA